MIYNSHEANGWCNNHNHKYFVGNQLSKTIPFSGSPQAIIYQLSNHHSTQYITYRCQKIYFTVVICVYLIVSYLFCIKWLFSNLFSFHFQSIVICMHMCTHDHLMMVTETSKTTKIFTHFFDNMFLY